MKKFGILVLAAAVLTVMALASCVIEDGKLKAIEGGTITVKNKLTSNKVGDLEQNIAYVTITEVAADLNLDGFDFSKVEDSKKVVNNQQVAPQASKDFKIDKNGTYVITYYVLDIQHLINMPELVIMIGGNKKEFDIDKSN